MIGCHDSVNGFRIAGAQPSNYCPAGEQRTCRTIISGRTTWVMRKVALGNPDKQNPAES